MPARLVQVTLINNSRFPIIWQDDGRPHGWWQEPWYPSNLKNLKTGEQGTWRLESGGIMTGVEGWAYFRIDVPSTGNTGVRTEYLNLWWERPYIGSFAKETTHFVPDGEYAKVMIVDRGFTSLGQSDSFFEPVPFGAFVPATVPVFLANDAAGTHIWWIVEVVDSPAAGLTLPLVIGPTHRYADAVLINAEPADVWDLLTKTGPASAFWQQQAIESDWRVGSPIRFIDVRDRNIAAEGTIIEAAPPNRLVYTINTSELEQLRPEYDRDSPPPPPARITISIEPHERGSKLSLLHEEPMARGAVRDVHDVWRSSLSGLRRAFEKRGLSG
ncbi:MAG TPA: SRPBCC domain-containing protein [Gammaproteobacteria bacterium]